MLKPPLFRIFYPISEVYTIIFMLSLHYFTGKSKCAGIYQLLICSDPELDMAKTVNRQIIILETARNIGTYTCATAMTFNIYASSSIYFIGMRSK